MRNPKKTCLEMGSDEEGPEEENADELKWRMERFEREKFLEEQRVGFGKLRINNTSITFCF